MATPPLLANELAIHDETTSTDTEIEPLAPSHPDNPNKPAPFGYITENVYISPVLHVSKERKRAKRMVCECQFDPELDDLEEACGENCLNRVLMIECGSRCPCGEYCTNKRFQRADYAHVEVFKTENKGWGLRACKDIPPGDFVMEYCGEVCTLADFEQRKIDYIKEKRRHYYFMSLKTDEILDATRKGNYSRYINHSCDPNCETQKWTVGGRLRIGFFSIKTIKKDEELTFDYKFQRFGDQAQKCYCGSTNCRGFIGQSKQSSSFLKVVPVVKESGSPRSPKERRRGRPRVMSDADNAFEKEVFSIVGSSWRLRDSVHVLALSRIMLQAETISQRAMLLQVLLSTEDTGCLKRFLSLQGLRLLWSWMIDSGDSDTINIISFRIQILQLLDHLPVTTKNQLEDNKILPVVKKWSESCSPGEKQTKSHEVKEAEQPRLPTSTVPDEHLKHIVVTEADSAQSEKMDAEEFSSSPSLLEGSEVNSGKIYDSCEAEARYITSDHSQDGDVGERQAELGQEPPSTSPGDGNHSHREASPDNSETNISHSVGPQIISATEAEANVGCSSQPTQDHCQNSQTEDALHSDDCALSMSLNIVASTEQTSDREGSLPVEKMTESMVPEENELSPTIPLSQENQYERLDSSPEVESDIQSPSQEDLHKEQSVLQIAEVGQNQSQDEGSVHQPQSQDTESGLISQNEECVRQSQSQDEGSGLVSQDEEDSRELLASLAEKLVEKWEGLKEVFRIPKRAPKSPQTKTHAADREDSSNDGGLTDCDTSEDIPPPPIKRARATRHSSERTWSRRHRGSVHRHSSHSSHSRSHINSRQSHITSSTPSQPYTQPVYNTGFPSGASVQNTVIVQHPGHSVYVQQQVFKDSCHTTVLPAPQYLNTQPPTSQYVQVPVPPTPQGILLPPNQQGTLIQSNYQGSSIVTPQPGTMMPSNYQSSVVTPQQGTMVPSNYQSSVVTPQQGTMMPSNPSVNPQQGTLMQSNYQGSLVTPQQGGMMYSTQQGLMVPPTQQRLLVSNTPQPTPLLPNLQHSSSVVGHVQGSGSAPSQLQVMQQGTASYGIAQPGQLPSQQIGSVQPQQCAGYQSSALTLPQAATTALPPLGPTGQLNQQQYLQYNSQQVYTTTQTVSKQLAPGQPKPLLGIQPPLQTPALGHVQTSALPAAVAQQASVLGTAQTSVLPQRSSTTQQISTLAQAPLPPPPPDEADLNLPQNWKTARDPNGKVYYYHVITRKTQWEPPTEQDVEGTITMDLGTPEPESDSEHGKADDVKGPQTPTDDCHPHTPDDTPPMSPSDSIPHTPTSPTPHTPASPTPHTPTSPTPHTPASPMPHTPTSPTPHTPTSPLPHKQKTSDQSLADKETSLLSEEDPETNLSQTQQNESQPKIPDHMSGSPRIEGSPYSHSQMFGSTPSPRRHSPHSRSKARSSSHRKHKKSHSKQENLREAFRHKVSKLVTHCLDQHRKPDCKYGRITCVEDFKHLARKLSHGLTEKEIARKGGVDKVELTDSVKAKAKEYIRRYMKKFGSVYVRNRSP